MALAVARPPALALAWRAPADRLPRGGAQLPRELMWWLPRLPRGGAGELIRQVTVNLPERGVLLSRCRGEARMNISAYQVPPARASAQSLVLRPPSMPPPRR